MRGAIVATTKMISEAFRSPSVHGMSRLGRGLVSAQYLDGDLLNGEEEAGHLN